MECIMPCLLDARSNELLYRNSHGKKEGTKSCEKIKFQSMKTLDLRKGWKIQIQIHHHTNDKVMMMGIEC